MAKVFPILIIAAMLALGGCTLAPQIHPQVDVKEEPTLNADWFKTEEIPSETKMEVTGTLINGQVWTSFSPKSSRELAVENKELRRKLELMDDRMALLYKRYFHKNHPTWTVHETITK
jgi:hypothetical protein